MKPVDEKLYNRVKHKYQEKMPNSAYRSGLIVKEYKRLFQEKYGKNARPYYGRKTPQQGLSRWFAEDWRNESGNIGYDKNNHLYRPTHIVNDRTPKTWDELSQAEIQKAECEKRNRGRVSRF